jgi:hypothetical protein
VNNMTATKTLLWRCPDYQWRKSGQRPWLSLWPWRCCPISSKECVAGSWTQALQGIYHTRYIYILPFIARKSSWR